MKNSGHNITSPDNLRKKAEDQIRKNFNPTDPSLLEGDSLKLIYELQVHQIELEMQNEELIKAQTAAQDAIELYDFAPTGYFTLSKDETIIGLNLSGAEVLHKDKRSLKGSKFGSFVSDDTKEIFNTFLRNIFNTKTKETCEIKLLTSGYAPIDVILTGIIRRNEDKCLISSFNITALKQYEAKLKFERELYEDIVNNEPAGIYRIRVFKPEKWWKNAWSSSENPPYRMELASDRFCEILGITRHEFETNPEVIADLIYPEDKQDFVNKNEEANNRIISFRWEGRLLIKNKISWVHLESIPRPIADKEVLWTGILYDITDQKQTEIALKESENKYRELVDNSPDAIAIYNESGIVFINHECLHLMRASTADELTGRQVIEFVHPDYRSFVSDRMNNTLNEGKTLPLTEERFIRLDGETIDVEVKSMPIRFQNKPAVQLIVRDITERKRAESQLIQSENRFQQLFTNAPLGYQSLDVDGFFIEVNQQWLNILGFTRDEVIGKWFGDFLSSEFKDGFRKRFPIFKAQGHIHSEFKMVHKNGTKLFIAFDGRIGYEFNGEFKQTHCILQDITQQRIAENELKKSREDFKDLFDNAPVGYHEIDAEGKILRMNQTELTMLGYDQDEVIGQYIWKFNIDENYAATVTKEKLQGLHISSKTYERNFKRKDGSVITVLEKDRVLFDTNGKVTGIRSSVNDISERKEAEEKLQLSEEKFRSVFENSVVGKSLTSIEGKLNANKAFTKIVGYSLDELSSLHWNDFTHKDDIEFNKLILDSILKGEKEFSHWEKRFIHKNGDIIWVDISTFLLRDHDGNPVHFITEIYDITDRKKAETDLRNSEEKFKKAFITNPDSVNINRLEDGMYISINPGFTRTMGYDEKDVIGKTSKEINIWNNLDDRIRLVKGLKEKGMAENLITQFRTKTGRLVFGMMSASVIELEGISHILSITRDITEIKNTEFALQQSEELYSNLVLRIPDGVYKSTEQGKFIDVNPALVKMLGYESKEELMKIDIKSQLYFDISDRESETLNSKNEEMSVFPLKKKDGSKIWIEDHGWYNTDSDGNIVTHEGVLRDITQRKLAEDELVESKGVLNDLLYASVDFIDTNTEGIDYKKMTDTILKISGAKYATMNILDPNGDYFTTLAVSGLTDLQQKVKDTLGFDLINKKWKTNLDIIEQIKLNTISHFNGLTDLTGNLLSKTIIRLIEKTFNIDKPVVVNINKNNKFIGIFTFIFSKGNSLKNQEIVELFAYQAGLYIDRENSAKALRESEGKYRYLFANNPQPMYIHDVDTLEFLEVNQAAIDHYGYSKEEFLSMTLKDIRPPEDIPALISEIKDIRETFKPSGVWRHVKKNGEVIFVDITAVSVNLNGKNARHVMIVDTTERKKIEDALKESEDKYRTMIENSNDLIWTLDKNGFFTFLNKVALKTTELNLDDWKGKSFVPLIMSEDLPMLMDVFSRTMNGEICNYELRFTKKDDTILTIFVNTSPIYHSGIIEGIVSFGRDITESKKAMQQLLESEEKFRSIAEQTGDLISIADINGILIYASTASKSIFQCEPDEMCSHSYTDFLDDESIIIAKNAFKDSSDYGKSVNSLELKMIRKDGTKFYGELNGSRFKYGDHYGTLVVIRDISERKMAQQELEEKMNDLLRFHKLTVDRELTMIELKKEINKLLAETGQREKYRIVT